MLRRKDNKKLEKKRKKVKTQKPNIYQNGDYNEAVKGAKTGSYSVNDLKL